MVINEFGLYRLTILHKQDQDYRERILLMADWLLQGIQKFVAERESRLKKPAVG